MLAATGKLRVPDRRDYGVMATLMVLRLAVVTSFVFLALQFTPAGRSSVLVYSSVLWAAPLGRWLLGERVTAVRQAGVVAGIVGVVIIVSPWDFDWNDRDLIIGYSLLLAASVAQSLGAVHIRGHTWHVQPLSYMPWQLVGSGLGLAVLAVLLEGSPHRIEPSWTSAWILGYQCLIASAFGFWGVLTVSRNLPAVSSQLILMSAPAVGVVTSAVLPDERVDLALLVGMVLIFAGVLAGMLSGRDASRRPSADLP